jgi:hypothetical protein
MCSCPENNPEVRYRVMQVESTWIINELQFFITIMESQKSTNANKLESNSVQKPAFQYGLSISIGVLTILLLSVSYYYGIFRF